MGKNFIWFCLVAIMMAPSVVSPSQNLPDGNWKIFDTDVLGFFYISDGQQLIKTDVSGNTLATYQDAMLGEISQIDCYQGLECLILHKESNTIVLVDNNLAPLGEPVDMADYGFFDIQSACIASGEGYWVAEPQSGQILLLDKSIQVKMKGAVYTNYSSGNILYFAERNGQIHLVTSNNEYVIFDRLGSFIGRTTVPDIRNPHFTGYSLIYVSQKNAISYQPVIHKYDTLVSNHQGQINAVLKSKNTLYLLSKNRIEKLKP